MTAAAQKTRWILLGVLATAAAVVCFYLAETRIFQESGPTKGSAAAVNPEVVRVVRLGLAPEQDIFKQRKAYLALKEYLEEKLNAAPSPEQANKRAAGRVTYRVELLTASSYAAVLKDFEENKIDAAFMGSLVALVAIDRYQAEVVLKSQRDNGQSTYSGVVFVPDDSPVKTFADLRGKRLGAVRTTTGGAVFPLFLMHQAGMTRAETSPELVWSGTHEDVIREVVAGHLQAGAVKDVRLRLYQAEHPEVRLRVIAESLRNPDNALVLNHEYPREQRDLLVRTLMAAHEDPRGAAVLAQQNIKRYVPCQTQEYDGLYDMLQIIGMRWEELQIPGPAPHRRSLTALPEGR